MGRHRKKIPELKELNNRARVWWEGRWHYIGPWGTPETAALYAQFVTRLAIGEEVESPTPACAYTVVELLADYLDQIKTRGDAKLTARVARVAKLLSESHGLVSVSDFGPKAVDAWRKWLANEQTGLGLRATTVRYYVRVVVDALSHAIRVEKVQPDETKLASIRELGPIDRSVKSAKKILPVSDEIVDRTLPHLRGPVAAMVKLQRLTGMRPTEVMRMTPRQVYRHGRVHLSSGVVVDLDRHPGMWVYVPTDHKLKHRGKPRDMPLGPQAQAILLPFLDRSPDEYLFTPRESLEELRAIQRAERAKRGGGSGGNRKKPRARKHKISDHYTGGSYGKAIRQTCSRNGIPHWHPYQLRHSAGSEALANHGLDATRAMLGHGDPQTTMIYAERDFALALKIAAEHG